MTLALCRTAPHPLTEPAPRAGKLVALGDSIAFGDNPHLPKKYPALFPAYADLLGSKYGLKVVNFGAPGETSQSLLDTFDSNGSWVPDPNDPSHLVHARPLHMPYEADQTRAAVDYLAQHPETELVTLTIGGNDLLVAQKKAEHGKLPVPVAELAAMPVVTAHLYQHVREALAHVRSVYAGPIVVTNIYDTNYGNPIHLLALGLQAKALARATKTADFPGSPARVADIYGAFRDVVRDTPGAHGSAGAAGLLIPFRHDGNLYDVHPSAKGRNVIANTIERVVDGLHHADAA